MLARRAASVGGEGKRDDMSGEVAYRVLLLALAGWRRVDEMYELLDYMEGVSSLFSFDTIGISLKTYIFFVVIFVKIGFVVDA